MNVVDLVALTPSGISPSDWQPVYHNAVPPHGPATYLLDHTQRLAWLKRLQQEDKWADVHVTTDQSEFPFWRLVPHEFVVQDTQGKKLGKAQRTTDELQWAAALQAGSTKKPDITRWLKDADHRANALAMVKELAEQEPAADILFTPDGVYELVDITRFIEIRKKILAQITFGGSWSWDCETDQAGEEDQDSPNPYTARLVGVSISIREKHAWYFPVGHLNEDDTPHSSNLPTQDIIALLRECFERVALVRKWGMTPSTFGHNVKYDYSVLANPVQGVPVDEVYTTWLPYCQDTMLLAAVCNMPAKLKVLAPRLLGVQVIDYKKLTGGRSFAYVPPDKATVYAAQDADWPLRLWPILQRVADELQVQHVYEQDELPIIEYFMRMERRGFKVNVDKLTKLHEDSIEKRHRARTRLVEALRGAGVVIADDFNPGSSQQLSRALFAPLPDGLALPVLTRTDTGAASTSKIALNKLKAENVHHPALLWVREWSAQEQMVTAFTEPLLKRHIKSDGRVHPNYHSVGAQTGRTSCTDPNAQQLPKPVRECIEPEDGGEVAGVDYSQIELRVLAAEFNEPKMLETFNLPRFLPNGEENPEADIHGTTQREVGLKTRTLAKNFNFGKAFRAGKDTLSVTAGIPVQEAAAFSDRFDKAYPDLTRNIQLRVEQATEEGLVRTWRGRVRLVAPPQDQRAASQNTRIVANTPVQGGALDIIKWAMRLLLPLVRKYEAEGIHAWNMVHDELDFEHEARCSQETWLEFLHEVQRVMEACNPFADRLPIYTDLEVGPNWGQLRVPDADLVEAA